MYKNRRTGLLVLLLVLLVGGILFLVKTNKNDPGKMEIIEQYLWDTYKTKGELKAFDTQHHLGYASIAFAPISSPQEIGFAVLTKDPHSTVDVVYATPFKKLIKRGLDIYVKDSDLRDADNEFASYKVVLSSNPNLHEIRVTLGGEPPKVIEVNENPSMTWIELPRAYTSAEYRFYDHEGQVIR
ncbi:hypothetical protein IDH44_23160 [Paenibacillus sp. IB182496]|uniref:Uncharacterized protein n=1 Tax=Paenibacillus sabuli TaxID=2772509 RepID=A0A927BXD7_9BACL|nr:hypothetical protein [Paenibacillus sabuli]MBD2848107.1 hypothetical protein [Paenibacillus sabuli]